MFPAAFLRETHNSISDQMGRFWIKNERFAYIAEWETDSTPPGEGTAYFHQRYQRGQPASPRKLKVKGLMVIGLMKHLCPGTGVKATGIAVQGNHKVPSWIVDGINDAHLQRFLAPGRLNRGILAKKRRRLHKL